MDVLGAGTAVPLDQGENVCVGYTAGFFLSFTDGDVEICI